MTPDRDPDGPDGETPDHHSTDPEVLAAEQARKERSERQLAEEADGDEEAAAHGRRAERAEYLQEKLSEQARADRAQETDA